MKTWGVSLVKWNNILFVNLKKEEGEDVQIKGKYSRDGRK